MKTSIIAGLGRAFTASRRTVLGSACAALCLAAAGPALAADKATAIAVDWATYNPLSVLIKAKGWMEAEFAADKIEVKWVQSAGSNLALSALNAKTVDFGSTAGAAALMGRVNGGEFKTVYVFSKPEWTALLVKKDSAIKSVADLKDKRVAAARGTDPHIFLIRALKANNLTTKDVKLVLMQHKDGQAAVEAGEVDAWMGLDPLMAQSELKGGTKLLYRNADYNTFGVLNVRDEFANANPALVSRVLKVYENARKAALANPAELKAAMVAATGLPEDVIARQLERTDLSNGAVGAPQRTSITAAGQALQEAGVVPGDVDVAKTVDAMLEAKYLK
jgi:sulfonate transport system substrate-binding protein